MKKKIALVLVAVMAAKALFACGKKDNGSGTAKKTAKVIDIDLTSEEYGLGVDKDQADLLLSVNTFTRRLRTTVSSMRFVITISETVSRLQLSQQHLMTARISL